MVSSLNTNNHVSTTESLRLVHSVIAITYGSIMMFQAQRIYVFSHGIEIVIKILGSTPHDQVFMWTSDSFSELFLFAIGLLLFMVAFVKDKEFHGFFAKGCTVLHVFMALWRIWFEMKVEDLAWDCLRQTIGDVILSLSWVYFLLCSWREKYD